MTIARTLLTTSLTILLGAATAAAQHEGHQMPAAPGAAAATPCSEAQASVTATFDALKASMEAARLSNSAAAMRAALDDVQAAMLNVRRLLEPCQPAAAASAAPAAIPNVQQAPAAAPGTPAMAPGSPSPAAGAVAPGAPAPAGAADPHAGHTMNMTATQTALVKDPKCAANVDPRTSPQAPYGDQTYYFCAERDRQLFLADPAKYLGASAAADPHAGHVMPPANGAPAAADPHAGHVMPPAGGAPAAADPHAGHVMPAPATAGVATADPHAGHTTPAAADAHAGHVMPNSAAPAVATSAATKPAPPTSVDTLKCDRAVDAKTAPRVLYQGRMYYFCTAADRDAFVKAPAQYKIGPASTAPAAHAH